MIRTLSTLLIALSFLPLTMYSQSSYLYSGAGFGLGNLEGFERANFAGSVKLGYYHGFSSRFGLSTELQYLNSGNFEEMRLEGGANDLEIRRTKIRVQFLDLGIDARVNLNDHFFLTLGPLLGLRLDARFSRRVETTNGNIVSETNTSENMNDLVEQFDYGFRAGVGTEVGDRLALSINFQQGLRNLWTLPSTLTEYRRQAVLLTGRWEFLKY